MNIDIIAAIPVLLWALNVVVVVGGGVVGTLLSFWLRKDIIIADKIQKFKWRSQWDGASGDWIGGFVFMEGIVGVCISLAISKLLMEGIALPIIIAISAILALVFIPRWVIDICKGLKMNHKSGDLEELSELKKKVKELEQKMGK